MKRDLFVFAGQSNMMGASVYPPQKELYLKDSYEYKHKLRRFGELKGDFVPAGYPVGEFSYADIEKAYASDMVNEKLESKLAEYGKNTYFCPAMASLASDEDKTEHPFAVFSESWFQCGASLAPLLAEEWERGGNVSAYAHIAKGAVRITHFLTDEMRMEYNRRMVTYNRLNGTKHRETLLKQMPGAAEYFFEKCKDFFSDAEKTFPDDEMPNRCFFWHQGEGDADCTTPEYRLQLEVLWDALKQIGFTHFFCIRVGYFGNSDIINVMRAQEEFTDCCPGAFMLTRAASYFTYAGREEGDWFIESPEKEYENCRDSFAGYPNQHINEKGFSVIARHAAKNLSRVLNEGKAPLLENENIKNLKIVEGKNETISV